MNNPEKMKKKSFQKSFSFKKVFWENFFEHADLIYYLRYESFTDYNL